MDYANLPPEQHRVQRLVDLWNADERLWQELEPRRRLRRALRKDLSEEELHELDLREFANARPPQDAVSDQAEP